MGENLNKLDYSPKLVFSGFGLKYIFGKLIFHNKVGFIPPCLLYFFASRYWFIHWLVIYPVYFFIPSVLEKFSIYIYFLAESQFFFHIIYAQKACERYII